MAKKPGFRPNFDRVYFAHIDETKIMKPTSLRTSREEATLDFDPASVVCIWLPLLETKVLKSTLLRPRPSFARVYLAHVDETKVSSPHCLRRVVANEPGFRPNFDSVYLAHVDEARL